MEASEAGNGSKCGIERTCLKSVFDDMTLWRTKRGEVRDRWKEKEENRMVPWRMAVARIRDNMTRFPTRPSSCRLDEISQRLLFPMSCPHTKLERV
jgi:hypothetical protein